MLRKRPRHLFRMRQNHNAQPRTLLHEVKAVRDVRECDGVRKDTRGAYLSAADVFQGARIVALRGGECAVERNLPIVNEIDIEGERRCVLRQSGKEGDTPHACRHSDPRRHRRSASRRHDDNIRAAPFCHVEHRPHAAVCTCFDICVISHIVHIGKTLCAAVEEKNARPRRPCRPRPRR